MKSDLSKVKVGDKTWTIKDGWSFVEKIMDGTIYGIKINSKYYTIDGRLSHFDKYPSAFLTNPFESLEPQEYFVKHDNDFTIKKGIVKDNKFYVESEWKEWILKNNLDMKIDLSIENKFCKILDELYELMKGFKK
jgi:hypothetical protein